MAWLAASLSQSSIMRNSAWNFAGQLGPLLAAFLCIPLLITTIGDARFGFLSIAWVLAGYFSLFDLGIGRAVTHAVAKRQAANPIASVSDLVWTGFSILLVIGLLLALVMFSTAPWIVMGALGVEAALATEAVSAMRILACAIPLVVLTTGLRGLLEARQEFKAINAIMAPVGVLLFIAPYLVSRYSLSLAHIIPSLVAVRLLGMLGLLWLCAARVPEFFSFRFSMPALRDLLSFGGWMTVTNIASPLMVNMDRLVLGARASLSAVTYYATPFEVVSKLLVIPSSIAGASFPEFSRIHGAGAAAASSFRKAVLAVLALLAPPALVVVLFAHPLLSWWISPELADQSHLIMRLLAVGVVLNGLAYIPFAYIQGIGRSDITAKFHLLELAVYAPVLFLMIDSFGAVGAAIAWMLRVAFDCLLLFVYAGSRMGMA